ncbi:MAG: DUF3592 domain-containing protein [Polyangia bacterium]
MFAKRYQIALVGALLLGGGIYVLATHYGALQLYLETARWQEVSAEIETLAIDSHLSGGSNPSRIYDVNAAYRYEFGDQSYRGTRFGFKDEDLTISPEDEVAQVRRRSNQRCLVDPDNPERAVLYAEMQQDVYMYLIAGCVMLIAGPIVTVRSLRKR